MQCRGYCQWALDAEEIVSLIASPTRTALSASRSLATVQKCSSQADIAIHQHFEMVHTAPAETSVLYCHHYYGMYTHIPRLTSLRVGVSTITDLPDVQRQVVGPQKRTLVNAIYWHSLKRTDSPNDKTG